MRKATATIDPICLNFSFQSLDRAQELQSISNTLRSISTVAASQKQLTSANVNGADLVSEVLSKGIYAAKHHKNTAAGRMNSSTKNSSKEK